MRWSIRNASARCAAYGAIAAALFAASAGAAPTAQPWPHPMPATDGSSNAVWVDAIGAVQVLEDGQDASRVAGAVPDHCDRSGAVGGGRFGVLCDVEGQEGRYDAPMVPHFLDLVTGSWSRLPDDRAVLRATWFSPAIDAPDLIGLGTAALEIVRVSRTGGSTYRFSLTTGDQLPAVPASKRGQRMVEDLDSPTGRTRLCSPLRVRTYRYNNYGVIEYLPFAAAYRAPTLLTSTRRRLLLERCGSRRVRVLARSPDSGPLLTSRYVAWLQGTAVVVFFRATGERVRISLPGDPWSVSMSGTERRIWISPLGQAPSNRVIDLGHASPD